MPPKKDWHAFYAELARNRDLEAPHPSGLTGLQPAAQPAAPVAVPAPPDSAGPAGDALSRLKNRAGTEDAGFFQNWYDAAFFDQPIGALELFLTRIERGIAEGLYTIAQALQFIQAPANEQWIILMLSLSIPGRDVHLDELESWKPGKPEEVIETYMRGLYDSVQGDLGRLPKLAGLSLGGDAPPARAQVRRA